MITKEKFLEKCVCLFSEYDFSNIDWVDYNTPITVLCKKHGNFEIPPRKLYQQRGRCPKCHSELLSKVLSENAKQRLSKAKQTCLQKYGVENPYQAEEVKAKIRQTSIDRHGGIGNGSKEIADKISKTKEKKYGNSKFTNREKCKRTCIEKYGIENFGQSPNALSKKKKTCLDNFGVDNPWKSNKVREKSKATMMTRYGYDNYGKSKQSRQYLGSEEFKNKRRKTLHEHGTYGKSQAEDRCYDLLQSIFPNAMHHYTSDVYPFECDMYVPELDLYVECNFFWSHGGHFFDETNSDDLKTLEEWKSKNTKFYDIAIHVWTESDLKKLETAQKNNLNYLVCWSEEEFMSIFDRDFSEHDELPDKIKNVTQVAKLANWNEYFKREIEMLENPLVLGELFINRYKYLGKLPHQLSNLALLNGLSISGKLRKYSTFDNTGMIQFIEKYKPSIIYDPCSGWGERLLTCHQYGIKYLGFDINDNVVEGLNILIDKYNINATVQQGDSSKGSFTSDVLFTCPPYWNTEIYTDQGAENLSYEEFLVWWKSVIQKSGCKIVAYQINQRFKEDMNKQILDLGYSFVEEIVLPQKSSHFTRKDGNQKKEYESIQVFIG